MDLIRQKEKTPEVVLDEAKKRLTEILTEFKSKEKEIGVALLAASTETRDITSIIGDCPNCENGKIRLMKGKFGNFGACNNYPECKTTYNLPKKGILKPNLEKMCEHCGSPTILIIARGKQPQEFCINADCSGKVQVEEGEKVEGENETCTKCNKGKMILRKGPYGQFLGCDNYPKCKNLKQIPKK